MGARRGAAERSAERSAEEVPGHPGERRPARRLRLVEPPARAADPDPSGEPCACDEAGTTTAEYTVVTGAAVAFGALLFKLLTSEWGNRILSTAFSHVISLLGF